MGQLHSGDAPLLMNETDNSIQHLDVPIVPNPEVLRTDPPLRQNGRCLSQDQPGATHRPAAEMNEMPVARVAILARILTHRGDEDPIRKLHVSNRERIKKAGHARRSRLEVSNPNATHEQSSIRPNSH